MYATEGLPLGHFRPESFSERQLNLWCNPGATSVLNCQISLEKDSALSQESILMVAVSVVLPLAAGEL